MTDKTLAQLELANEVLKEDVLHLAREGADYGVRAETLFQELPPPGHAGDGGDAHAEATPTTAGFLSAADKARLDALGGAAFLDADAVASVDHTQAWSTVTGAPTTVAGYGITDVGAAAAWAFHRIDEGGVVELGAGDTRTVLYCAADGPLEIRIPADLGSGFECVVMTAPDSTPPAVTTAPGQMLRSDGDMLTRPGPAAAVLRRVGENAWIALGMASSAAAIDWRDIGSVPDAVTALGALAPGDGEVPLFTGPDSAKLMKVGAFGGVLVSAENAEAARGSLGLGTAAASSVDQFAPLAHGHARAEIVGLDLELAAKAPVGHIHDQADVTGLAGALAGKAAVGHGHAVADIDGLGAALSSLASRDHGHDEATVAAAGFLSATDKAKLDALGSAALSAAESFATREHAHEWSAISNPPTSVAGYGITDARHAARWPHIRVTDGGTRELAEDDARAVLYCVAESALEIRIPGDLGEDFECAVMVAPGASPPVFSAADGQALALDDFSGRARPGPSVAYVRRVDPDAWAVLGLGAESAAAAVWSQIDGVPPAVEALAALTPGARTTPFFDAEGAAALAPFGTLGEALVATSSPAEARGVLGLAEASSGSAYAQGRYFCMGLPGDSGALTTGYVGLCPFLVRSPAVFDRLAIEVVAARTASTIRIGVYAADGAKPASLLTGSAALSSATAGLRTHAMTLALEPGLYFLAYAASDSSVAVRMQTVFTPAVCDMGSADGLEGPSCYGIAMQPYGPLPSTFGAVTWLPGVTCPRVMVRAT